MLELIYPGYFGRQNLSSLNISYHVGELLPKIGERLTNAGLYEAASRFGFGGRTGSGLPGELHGLLRPLKDWTGYSTGSIPMGQEIAVTPLQLIAAYAALANGGRWSRPRRRRPGAARTCPERLHPRSRRRRS